MKRCPACQSTYTDETLIFCLQDGVPLEEAGTEYGEHETVIRQRTPEPVTVAIGSSESTREAKTVAATSTETPVSGSPRTAFAVFVTVIIMLVLFTAIGISVFLYFDIGKRPETAAVDSQAGNAEEDGIDERATNSEGLASPESSPKPPESSGTGINPPTPSASSTQSPTPDGKPDTGEIKKEIANRVHQWVSLAKARNLPSYMAIYGDRIDYYRKSGASRGFVRADKSKAFSKYDSIKIIVGNMVVTPNADGKTASAEFDKEFEFSKNAVGTSGKVRSKLLFRQFGGEWKIVGERDLKVYYVNR